MRLWRLLLITAVTVSSAVILMTSGSQAFGAASTANPPAVNVPGSPAAATLAGESICVNGHADCNWESGTTGSSIQNRPFFQNGGAQTYQLVFAECHFVGDGCNPFTTGSGLNADLAGSDIVTIHNTFHNDCITYIASVSGTSEGSCSGNNGEVWVAVTEGTNAFSLVSVNFSNYEYGISGVPHDAYDMQGCNAHGSSCYPPLQLSLGDCGLYCNWGEYTS